MSSIATLAETIQSEAAKRQAEGRFVVAIAGPPASGKSTLAENLAQALEPHAAVVSMDGFHYDDRVLAQKGLAHCKGAPETFDFGGFETLLKRIRSGEREIAIPVFDRSMELARAGAAILDDQVRIILVEGNYLLLDEAPWRNLAALFDYTVFAEVPREELDRRLVARWREHGREDAAARHWIDSNDMPNIDRVQSRRRGADLVIPNL